MPRRSRSRHGSPNMCGPEALLGVQPIVCAATEPQIRGRLLAASRPWHDVVELEKSSPTAPSTVRRHESAAPLVSNVHVSRDRRRDVTTAFRALHELGFRCSDFYYRPFAAERPRVGAFNVGNGRAGVFAR
jgi:hypothetical protein